MSRSSGADLGIDAVRAALKSQYHAALAMLAEAVERCPDDLWLSSSHPNACWQLAYHTVFFTHFYLQANAESLPSWSGHQPNVQHPDGIGGPADPASLLPVIPEPYTKAQVLEYCEVCDALVDPAIDAMDLASEASGFYWYPIPKLEHQLVNLRHVQHHVAQVTDRLRSHSGIGIGWVGSRRPRGE